MRTELTNKEKYNLLMKEDKSTIVRSFISLGNAYNKIAEDMYSPNSQIMNNICECDICGKEKPCKGTIEKAIESLEIKCDECAVNTKKVKGCGRKFELKHTNGYVMTVNCGWHPNPRYCPQCSEKTQEKKE